MPHREYSSQNLAADAKIFKIMPTIRYRSATERSNVRILADLMTAKTVWPILVGKAVSTGGTDLAFGGCARMSRRFQRRFEPDPQLGGLDEEILMLKEIEQDESRPKLERLQARTRRRAIAHTIYIVCGKVVALITVVAYAIRGARKAAIATAAVGASGGALILSGALITTPDREPITGATPTVALVPHHGRPPQIVSADQPGDAVLNTPTQARATPATPRPTSTRPARSARPSHQRPPLVRASRPPQSPRPTPTSSATAQENESVAQPTASTKPTPTAAESPNHLGPVTLPSNVLPSLDLPLPTIDVQLPPLLGLHIP
jgi:hypothetical protein